MIALTLEHENQTFRETPKENQTQIIRRSRASSVQSRPWLKLLLGLPLQDLPCSKDLDGIDVM
jgi:hypothetical protein